MVSSKTKEDIINKTNQQQESHNSIIKDNKIRGVNNITKIKVIFKERIIMRNYKIIYKL